MAIKVMCLGLPLHGPTQVSIELGPNVGLTLRELITRYLAPQFDGDLVKTLFDSKDLRESYVILVNGRNAMGLGGLDVPLGDETEVLIIPPVGGG